MHGLAPPHSKREIKVPEGKSFSRADEKGEGSSGTFCIDPPADNDGPASVDLAIWSELRGNERLLLPVGAHLH